MKSILQSYIPKEIEQISSGKQTIKLCKTAPKDTPFNVYMYETQGATETPWVDEDGHFVWKGCGKVVGEYVCDIIDKYNTSWLDGEDRLKETACLDDVEIMDYMNGYTDRIFYGLHISELKIYDKSKELREFSKPNFFRDCENDCRINDNLEYYRCKIKNSHKVSLLAEWCRRKGKSITRAPKSRMYVEELK